MLFSKYLKHFKITKDKLKLINKGAIMIFSLFLWVMVPVPCLNYFFIA